MEVKIGFLDSWLIRIFLCNTTQGKITVIFCLQFLLGMQCKLNKYAQDAQETISLI
jgi:hypothetical protein